MKTVVLGVSGSISAYKVADITNELMKQQIQVEVIMTAHSQSFITPLTLQSLSKRPVHTDVMAEMDPNRIQHIDLAKKTDLFLVAPASANVIGKLANGIADDMLSTFALAVHGIPMLIAPAMNTYMYTNPIVQDNLKKLTNYGYHIIEPRESLLACGDFGIGALATVDDIVQQVKDLLIQ